MAYKDRKKQLKYQSEHYQLNKEIYKERLRQRRSSNKEFVNDIKSKGKCKCGENDIDCLDYHHLNQEDKCFSINYAVKQGYSEKRILEEIEKCELICANCHSILHERTIVEYTSKRRERNANWLKEYKSDKHCSVCGKDDQRYLCFHHIKDKDKKDAVANMATSSYSISSILKEIEKCIILCSNCHRKKHKGNRWLGSSCKKNN